MSKKDNRRPPTEVSDDSEFDFSGEEERGDLGSAPAEETSRNQPQARVQEEPEPEGPKRRRKDPADEAAPARGYPDYPPGSQLQFEEVHLLDYVRVLYKRRWTAATAFAVVFLAVTIYTFTATPIYEARTQLLIESENPNVVSFKEVIDQEARTADYYQTQYSMLQSRSLAKKTLDALKLWETPPFGGEEAQSSGVRRMLSGLLSAVTQPFGSASSSQIPADGETAAQSHAIDVFLDDLRVSPIRNSRLVDIRYRSPKPRLATNAANALARAYIEQNLEFKFMASKEATDWLGERLAEQRRKVEASEASLQQYREQHDAIALEDRENIVVQRLADLNAAVTRARTDRLQKEARYRQLQGIQADQAALDTFPDILGNTFIQQLKSQLAQLQREKAQLAEKLGPRHPDMIKVDSAVETTEARLKGEISKVVESVRNEFEAAQSQERSLSAALDAQKNDALALNRRGIEYSVLQREAESNRQIYESLLQRTKETGISGELKTSNIRVVDEAEMPRTPVSPRKGLNLLLALLGGTMLAAGLAFFFEYLDNRIKTPDEIKTHLGLPSLGMIPAMSSKDLQGTLPLIHNGVPAYFVEALRSVRTNLVFSSAEQGMLSVLVTSTAPGEGKTLVASNLAIGLAQAGQRVLLIDADMRKPRQHDLFEHKQEPGLSNLLVGGIKASDVVRKTKVPGLRLITSGKIPPNPAELLGSRRFKDFVAGLQDVFDWVIIDSPPVMAVTDASVIAHRMSGVLFVVGAEMIGRQAAQAALEQLDAARAKFFGAVLNRVEVQRNSYYYSRYYRREYGDYYRKATTA